MFPRFENKFFIHPIVFSLFWEAFYMKIILFKEFVSKNSHSIKLWLPF